MIFLSLLNKRTMKSCRSRWNLKVSFTFVLIQMRVMSRYRGTSRSFFEKGPVSVVKCCVVIGLNCLEAEDKDRIELTVKKKSTAGSLYDGFNSERCDTANFFIFFFFILDYTGPVEATVLIHCYLVNILGFSLTIPIVPTLYSVILFGHHIG